jgi:tripartite-type tricarboxylate transporter receptor subunit TctC
MNIDRRTAIAATLSLAFGGAAAQSGWPAGKPIRMIVPFAVGGATDVAARVLGQALAESLQANVIVDNKPGAHGFVGVGEATRAAADGYTLLMASIGTISINPGLHEKLPYDPNRDLAPVALVSRTPVVLVTHPSALPGVNDARELVAYLKAHPGKVNYGSAGSGGTSHLVPEYLKFRTGTFMTHIPYRGESAALSDLLAGQVQVMFTTLINAAPHIKSGRLKLIAVTSEQRLPELPDVPTVAEGLGLKDFAATSWQALYAPAATPREIINRLAAAVDAILKSPAMVKRLADLGALPGHGVPDELARFQRAEQDKWLKVIRAAKIKAD